MQFDSHLKTAREQVVSFREKWRGKANRRQGRSNIPGTAK